jgi:putative transposase
MIVLEFKVKGKLEQFEAIDEAIRAAQFIRNKALRFWMDNHGVGKNDLQKLCAKLAKEFQFADELNSQARQASAERAWSAISRFYENCKAKIPGKKGYPQFKHNSRSVEYKTSGWKLDSSRRYITFSDAKNIGSLKLVGTRDFNFYQINQIRRVRLVRRADGYYCQFLVAIDVVETVEPAQQAVGLDVGLNFFYTD